MKKILLLLTVLLMVSSCSIEPDKTVDFDIVFIAADSIDVPAYVTRGDTYPLKMYYKKPTDCYYVSDAAYSEIAGSIYKLAVPAYLIQDANCQANTTAAPEQMVYNFTCPFSTATSFTFKFYNGDDAQGNQKFIEVEVPVQQ